jgi:hypothetical protein
MQGESHMSEEMQRNWFQRNWKWAVPAGCLSLILLFFLFAGSIAMFVFGMMKSSPAYDLALRKAAADPQVTAALGTPLTAGYFVSGNVNESGVSGHAELAIPVTGPRGAGTIYVVGDKQAGHWTYSTLAVEVEATGKRIELDAAGEQ